MSDVLSAPGVAVTFDDLMRLEHLGRALRSHAPTQLTALPGGFVHRRRGRGLDIHDIRPWQHGDDIRHTDHNATARTGTPYTRTFRDEREGALLLVADFRPSMLFGTRTAFRSVAASQALVLEGWRSVSEGGKVGAMALLPSETRSTPPGRGTRGMTSIIGFLARAHADALADPRATDPPLGDAMEATSRLVPHGGSILVATALDDAGDAFDPLILWLARRNDVQFILIRDAFERAPPPGSYPYVTASGTRGTIRIAGRTLPPDQRRETLRRLGATAIVVDADAGTERIAQALETLHV